MFKVFQEITTKKLYLSDSYIQKCKAEILKISVEKGKRAYISLDQTIFHPLGGGQPSDKGIIKTHDNVFHVKKALKINNTIVHWGKFESNEPYFNEGDIVECLLDWNRRYYIMKLHTAGHILDFAMLKYYGRLVETISAFHGPPNPYLEYKVEEKPNPSVLEEYVMKVVKKSIPVKVFTVNKADLKRYLYNAPNLERLPHLENYRIVSIEGVNSMPCTGTHVNNTSEIGRFKIKSMERTKEGWKIYYDVDE